MCVRGDDVAAVAACCLCIGVTNLGSIGTPAMTCRLMETEITFSSVTEATRQY